MKKNFFFAFIAIAALTLTSYANPGTPSIIKPLKHLKLLVQPLSGSSTHYQGSYETYDYYYDPCNGDFIIADVIDNYDVNVVQNQNRYHVNGTETYSGASIFSESGNTYTVSSSDKFVDNGPTVGGNGAVTSMSKSTYTLTGSDGSVAKVTCDSKLTIDANGNVRVARSNCQVSCQ